MQGEGLQPAAKAWIRLRGTRDRIESSFDCCQVVQRARSANVPLIVVQRIRHRGNNCRSGASANPRLSRQNPISAHSSVPLEVNRL
jgi:hypothetical protein